MYRFFWSPALAMGPLKSCPLVRLFVSDAVFSELARYIFLISCMKLGEYICSKVTGPVFAQKIWFGRFWPKMAQIGPKNGSLYFCEKSIN